MNFKDLTYSQKNIFLLVGAVVFAFVAYISTISKMFQLHAENAQLERRIVNAETAPRTIAQLESKLANLNDKLSYYLIDTIKNHEYLLDVVSEFCQKNRLVVKELPRKSISEEKDFVIETSILTIEGNFSELLLLVNELERKHKLGRLSSVNFKTYLDNRRKKTVLSVVIYLQNIGMNVQKTNKSDEKI